MTASRLARRVAVPLVVFGLALLSANGAAAAPVPIPETGIAGDLRLASDPTQISFPMMSPGSTGYAAIDMQLIGKQWAEASIEIVTSGGLMQHPNGLALGVERCAQTWRGVTSTVVADGGAVPVCDSGAQSVLPLQPGSIFVTAGGVAMRWQVGVIRSSRAGHLLLTLRLPPSGAGDSTLQGLSGNFGIRAFARGDESIVLPDETVSGPGSPGDSPDEPNTSIGRGALAGPVDDPLASSGIAVAGWLAFGAGAVVLGATALVARRTSRPRAVSKSGRERTTVGGETS